MNFLNRVIAWALIVLSGAAFAESSVTIPNPALYTNAVRADIASTAANKGASLVGFNAAVGRTVQDKLADHVSVFDFFTAAQIADVRAGTASLDLTTPIQNAITTLGANARIFFPAGTYKVTGNLLVVNDRVHLVGAGMYATKFLFAPTANGALLTYKKTPGAPIYQGSIRDMTFYSNDSTYTKTALDLYDISTMNIENIVIGGSVVFGGGGFWRESAGSSSIGVRTHGREAASFRNLMVYADKPIVISPLLSGGLQISLDHSNFHNLYLSAANNPIVTVEAGCVLTQISFGGYQAWVGGTGGIYWYDTVNSNGASNGLSFQNVRYENATDATKYFMYINNASGLQGLTVNAGQAGFTKGFYLRYATNVRFDNFFFTDSSREALNADATVYPILMTGSYWQTGSTASLSGLVAVDKKPSAIAMPLPGDGLLTLASTTSYNWEMNGTLGDTTASLASNATMSIGSDNQRGFVMITTSADVSAIYCLSGGTHSTIEVSDPFGFFTPTAGSASSFNVYWSAGNSRYELENKTASAVSVKIVRFGTGQGF